MLNPAPVQRTPQLAPVTLSIELLAHLRRRRACDPDSAPAWRDALVELRGQLHQLDLALVRTDAERRAFWINLHNALILDGVTQMGITNSVREAPGFYRLVAYQVGSECFSADAIEHAILRANRPPFGHGPPVLPHADVRLRHSLATVDPRIHFALHCATVSCPSISAYDALQIEDQLDWAAAAFINGGAVTWDVSDRSACLSPLFDTYRQDFGDTDALAALLRRYLIQSREADLIVEALGVGRVHYGQFDWSLPPEEETDAGA
ncbi:MAG: DUF547 domain-containing protein [Dehalococcoidia bacterium]